jgi:hypothetical protein
VCIVHCDSVYVASLYFMMFIISIKSIYGMPSLFRWLSSNHAHNIPFLGWGVRGREDTAGKNWFVVGWGSTYLFTICNVFIDSLSWISAMNQFCLDCWAVFWSNSRSVIWEVLFPAVLSGGMFVIYFLK